VVGDGYVGRGYKKRDKDSVHKKIHSVDLKRRITQCNVTF
jgi:hypothetical protein